MPLRAGEYGKVRRACSYIDHQCEISVLIVSFHPAMTGSDRFRNAFGLDEPVRNLLGAREADQLLRIIERDSVLPLTAEAVRDQLCGPQIPGHVLIAPGSAGPGPHWP